MSVCVDFRTACGRAKAGRRGGLRSAIRASVSVYFGESLNSFCLSYKLYFFVAQHKTKKKQKATMRHQK